MKTIVFVGRYCEVINSLHLEDKTIKTFLKKRKNKRKTINFVKYKQNLFLNKNNIDIYVRKF